MDTARAVVKRNPRCWAFVRETIGHTHTKPRPSAREMRMQSARGHIFRQCSALLLSLFSSSLTLFASLATLDPRNTRATITFTGRTAHPLGGAGALVRPRPLRARVHRAAVVHGRDVQHDDRHHRGRDAGGPAELHRDQGWREPHPKCEDDLPQRLARFGFMSQGAKSSRFSSLTACFCRLHDAQTRARLCTKRSHN